MEFTCNWGGKLVGTCSTKNQGLLHVNFFMCIINLLVLITRGYQVKFDPYLFTCNPRCISHVDYWCTFSGVFHLNCFTWNNGVSVHEISDGYHVKNAT